MFENSFEFNHFFPKVFMVLFWVLFLFLSLSKKNSILKWWRNFWLRMSEEPIPHTNLSILETVAEFPKKSKKTDKVYTCFLKLFSKQWIPWITIHWNYVFFLLHQKNRLFNINNKIECCMNFEKDYSWIPRIWNQTFGIPLGLIDWIDRKKKW